MYYIGKHCDTFESALSQLLECAGCPQVPFIDCLSLRCFGFRTEGDIKTWFQPFTSLPEAVSSFSEGSGVDLRCKRICSAAEIPDGCHGVLLGPVEDSIAVPELQNHYYHGNGQYLFVQRGAKGMWEVFDPRGFAGLLLPLDRLDKLLCHKSVFCVRFLGYAAAKNEIRPDRLLTRGLAYHSRIAEDELSQLEYACGQYVDSGQSRLSLRYGILNLLQQLDKVFSLAALCGWDADRWYLEEKQALFAHGLSHTVSGLPETAARIWRSLDEGR